MAAKEAREAEANAEESGKKPAANANSDEVTLLGALIQCEAGGGSYEGMVAVGSVVMNRVRSGAYPGSIERQRGERNRKRSQKLLSSGGKSSYWRH